MKGNRIYLSVEHRVMPCATGNIVLILPSELGQAMDPFRVRVANFLRVAMHKVRISERRQFQFATQFLRYEIQILHYSWTTPQRAQRRREWIGKLSQLTVSDSMNQTTAR